MKLVTYRGGSVPRVGVQLADGVHDAGFAGDMVALIERWDELRDSVTTHSASVPAIAGAAVLAPLRPRSLRDFLTFEGHLKNAMANLGRRPTTRECPTRSSARRRRSRGPHTRRSSIMSWSWRS